MNHSQTSLQVVRGTNATSYTIRPGVVQMLNGLRLVAVVLIFGLMIASQATSQESMTKKDEAATANVLPSLFISPEALEPSLAGMLATGDGGAVIETQQTGK